MKHMPLSAVRFPVLLVSASLRGGHVNVLHQALAPVLLQIEWLEVFQLIVRFVAVEHSWALFVDLEREQSMKSNRKLQPGPYHQWIHFVNNPKFRMIWFYFAGVPPFVSDTIVR